MKKLALISILSAITLFAISQQTARSLTWDETEREYLEYVPTSYTGDAPAPVVFCLHGLGDNMNDFNGAGFNYVADQRGWIVITPQALMATVPILGEIGSAWNSGAGAEGTPVGTVILNENVDDSGFLMAILDSLENHFNINTDSIFFMGFSMGGFMSNRMAIEHGDRITAIASVSGTIGAFLTSEPANNINTLHIHGTADQTVSYENAEINFGSGMIYSVGQGAEECVEYWRAYNNTEETPIVNIFPDTQDDGKTFERYVYPNGDNDTYTAFIKVVGGDHDWYFVPQNDMDYTTEIYKFFTNTMDFSVGRVNNLEKSNFSIYPNPAKDYVTVFSGSENSIVKIYNMLGNLKSVVKLDRNNVIDISGLSEGMYIMRFSDGTKTIDKKLVVRR